MRQVSKLEVEIILLVEKYQKLNINKDIVIDLELILEKIRR
tara:strand:- start:1359 stop:1481 length:123 start_codon:yes stop_codon:yes gene_type:complete